jgi:hypothetical protein
MDDLLNVSVLIFQPIVIGAGVFVLCLGILLALLDALESASANLTTKGGENNDY